MEFSIVAIIFRLLFLLPILVFSCVKQEQLSEKEKLTIIEEPEVAIYCKKDLVRECFKYALASIHHFGNSYELKVLYDNKPNFWSERDWKALLIEAKQLKIKSSAQKYYEKDLPLWEGENKSGIIPVLEQKDFIVTPPLFETNLLLFLLPYSEGIRTIYTNGTISFFFLNTYYQWNILGKEVSFQSFPVPKKHPIVDTFVRYKPNKMLIHNQIDHFAIYEKTNHSWVLKKTFQESPLAIRDFYQSGSDTYLLSNNGRNNGKSDSFIFDHRKEEIRVWETANAPGLAIVDSKDGPIPLLEYEGENFPHSYLSKSLPAYTHFFLDGDLDGDGIMDLFSPGLGNLTLQNKNRPMRKKLHDHCKLDKFQSPVQKYTCAYYKYLKDHHLLVPKFSGTDLEFPNWRSRVILSKFKEEGKKIEERINLLGQIYDMQPIRIFNKKAILFLSQYRKTEKAVLYQLNLFPPFELKEFGPLKDINFTSHSFLILKIGESYYLQGWMDFNRLFLQRLPKGVVPSKEILKHYRGQIIVQNHKNM